MATAKINARFKDSGVPSTGLSPTVTIRNRSLGTTEVSAAAMTEIADGFYDYSFATFNVRYDYLFSFDGTATLADTDRYLSAEWSGMEEWLSQIPTGGGGGTIQEVNMTTNQYEELRDRLVTMMEGVEIDIPTGSIEEDVKKAIKELKDEAKDRLTDVSKKLLAESKKLSDRVKAPVVNVTTEKVEVVNDIEVRNFKERVDKMETFVDNMLGEFVVVMKDVVSDINADANKSMADFFQSQADNLKKKNN